MWAVSWSRPESGFIQFAAILITILPHHDISSRLQKKLELLSLERKSTSSLMLEMQQRRHSPISDFHDFLLAVCIIRNWVDALRLHYIELGRYVTFGSDFVVDCSLRSCSPALFPTKESNWTSLSCLFKGD